MARRDYQPTYYKNYPRIFLTGGVGYLFFAVFMNLRKLLARPQLTEANSRKRQRGISPRIVYSRLHYLPSKSDHDAGEIIQKLIKPINS